MTGQGLPYEECRRRQPAAPGGLAPLSPGYALPPPLHPGARRPGTPCPAVPRPSRRRARTVDGAFLSGVLTALGLACLLVAIAFAAG
ncbi:hypothetical protein ABZ079_31275 [Streptomyces sp. NPDC006314]|uniref:hypothetical protein n=1 Tax=Streptomyces sp. NPDC006314 TaxID=3154475 RepID=UPI0033B410EA